MKRKTKIILASIAGMIFLLSALHALFAWISVKHVAHGRPYRWDSCVLPEEVFSNTTVIGIVAKVNALVAKTSNGSVTQAVFLDTTPAKIEVIPADSPFKDEMDALILKYRQDETNWLNRGACGFETCRYTGKFMARHSLGCGFIFLADWVQMDYEEKPDAIRLARDPNHLECRAYKISPRLKQMADDLKRRNQIRVDMDPISSAFVDVTKMSLWSIDVPTGPNEKTGEFRSACIFKYLPESSVLLVVETPEAHKVAKKNLKEAGIWESI
jgi:hypothetical protein